jgi:hypothetical protein
MTYSKCLYCNSPITQVRYQLKSGKNSNRTICPSCMVSKRRWKSKIELVQFLGGKCLDCGYDKHPGALHFHHKDPATKKFELNANKLLVKDRWEEVKKCELLCSNCHSIRHTNTELINKLLNINL